MYSNVFIDFVETHTIFHHTFVCDIEQKALRILWVSSWFRRLGKEFHVMWSSNCPAAGLGDFEAKSFVLYIGCTHLWAHMTGCWLSFSLSDDTSKLSTLPRCKAINRNTGPYNHAEIHLTSHSWRFISLRARTNPFETVPSGGCGDAGPNRSKIYWIDMQNMFLHLQHWRFFPELRSPTGSRLVFIGAGSWVWGKPSCLSGTWMAWVSLRPLQPWRKVMKRRPGTDSPYIWVDPSRFHKIIHEDPHSEACLR